MRTLQTHDMIHKTLWTGQRSSSQVHSMYQHAHPPDCGWDCVAAALLDLRLISTMSSCLVEESVSIPSKATAIF